MKRLSALLVLLMLVVSFAQAQSRQVTGTVTSSDDGMPLIGVSIQVKGTTTGGTTDLDGKFNLNVPANGVLVFSFVGFKPQEVQVGERSVVNVILESVSQKMEEVVVTGYGVTKKSSFTGASSSVGDKELSGKFSPDPIKALEGNVTGLQMSTGSGQPGSPATIFIRGRNSLNSGTQPLYIVDGVPITSDAQGMRSSEGQTFSPLSTISPDDIETMTVLKDATATSIYGARAANGVIVITTKKGKQGQFNVNVTARMGFEELPKPKNYTTLNAAKYTELWSEAFNNDHNVFGSSSSTDYYIGGLGLTYDQAGYMEFLNWGTDYVNVDGTDTDWLKEVTRKGKIQQYTIDIQSGGAEKTSAKYFLSLDYLKDEALMRGKDMTRYSIRYNLDQAPSDYFKFGFNSNFSNTITTWVLAVDIFLTL